MDELDKLYYRVYYDTNREKILERQRKYDQANKERIRAYRMQWRADHSKEKRIYAQWYKLFGKKPKGITYEEMESTIKIFLGKE